MRPRVLVVLVAMLVAVLSASEARAEEGTVAWPRAASHVGSVEGDQVIWRSTFVDNVGDDRSGRVRIDLARPLVGEIDSARSPGVDGVVDGRGAILGFAIDSRRLRSWAEAVTVTVRTPRTRSGDALVLAPPVATGDAVQRVELVGDGDLQFEPAPDDGLVRTGGSFSTPGISESDRRATNARLGLGRGRLGEAPIYLKAAAPLLDRGIRGRARTAHERAKTGLIVAAIAFGVLLAACVVGYRRLGEEARIEQAEAALREEFDRPG